MDNREELGAENNSLKRRVDMLEQIEEKQKKLVEMVMKKNKRLENKVKQLEKEVIYMKNNASDYFNQYRKAENLEKQK